MSNVVRATINHGYGNKYRFYQSAAQLVTGIQSGKLDIPTHGRNPASSNVKVEMLFEYATSAAPFDPVAFEAAIDELRISAPRISRSATKTPEYNKTLKLWRETAIQKLYEVSHGLFQ